MTTPLVQDALSLSSGTICTLTGLRRYEDIERVQSEFVVFVEDYTGKHETWMDAWKAFELEQETLITTLVDDYYLGRSTK